LWEVDVDKWGLMVMHYTRCRITFAEDKLIAIAGVARRIADVSCLQSNQYLAGIWTPSICNGLAWSVTALFTSKIYGSSDYVAPSWSWASIYGRINTNDSKSYGYAQIPIATLQSSSIRTENDNNFGQVKGHVAQLKLGKFETMGVTTVKSIVHYGDYGEEELNFLQMGLEENSFDTFARLDDEEYLNQRRIPYRDDLSKMYGLVLREWRRHRWMGDLENDCQRIDGIILYEEYSDVYSRIGYFSIDVKNLDESEYRECMNYFPIRDSITII
jgi:hypothetical protein